jgi:hypothetical protein
MAQSASTMDPYGAIVKGINQQALRMRCAEWTLRKLVGAAMIKDTPQVKPSF